MFLIIFNFDLLSELSKERERRMILPPPSPTNSSYSNQPTVLPPPLLNPFISIMKQMLTNLYFPLFQFKVETVGGYIWFSYVKILKFFVKYGL